MKCHTVAAALAAVEELITLAELEVADALTAVVLAPAAVDEEAF